MENCDKYNTALCNMQSCEFCKPINNKELPKLASGVECTNANCIQFGSIMLFVMKTEPYCTKLECFGCDAMEQCRKNETYVEYGSVTCSILRSSI